MQGITKRGLVVSKYGSIRAFAKAMGWSYRRANYIVNERQEATATEIAQMADALEIEVPDTFRQIFLPKRSTTVDQ